jgi:hypothetical protein
MSHTKPRGKTFPRLVLVIRAEPLRSLGPQSPPQPYTNVFVQSITHGDIELAGYFANVAGPVPLMLNLRIAHELFGSSSDLNLNGHLHYPNEIDRLLNEAAADKIRKYHADYNNNPSTAISLMPAIASTSGRLHSEFVRLLFVQAHRENDRFFCSFRSSACAF